MSILNNSLLLGADAGGYQISRSLRFNSADSAYLSRTPASAGNRQTWTLSWWMKRSKIGGVNEFVFGTGGSNTVAQIFFDSSEKLRYGTFTGEPLVTAAVFRDTSAWYHCVFVHNTANATAADRLILYVNGVRADTSTYTAPSQNSDGAWNRAVGHVIGGTADGGSSAAQPSFNGYLADIHFIDGQALTPSSFAETNATTGQWVPKAYTGSYGTNGFRLNFSDNSAATATTLGKDRAGSNNWTPNNLSVTAGSGNDSLVDTPTSYGTDTGAGGEVRGNYATWNPLDTQATLSLANGNLDATGSTNGRVRATLSMPSGKWYWETTATAVPASDSNYVCLWPNNIPLSNDTYRVMYRNDGVYVVGGTVNTGWSTWTTGDIISVTFDADTRETKFYKNNTLAGTVTALTPPTGTSYAPALVLQDTNSALTANFGQRLFAYTAPSGFKALCDTNLPAPVVAKPSTVMDVALYAGTGSSLTATSALGFSPDLVWIKGRSGATDHALYDAVRGATLDLVSNSTAAETTQTQGLTAFNSNGFSVGTLAKVNTSSATYAAWTWDAGSSTVTNTSGSISSQVRANASAGFSIVTYTGNSATDQTIGHGLGVVPGMVIVKSRGSTDPWVVYHTSLGATKFLYLNQTTGESIVAGYWGTPSSTTFGIKGGGWANNVNGVAMVAYCFAPVAGYSSFGSYTGNGSTDGPFVFTGFRPAFVLVKGTGNGLIWTIEDSKRDTYNGTSKYLQPQSSDAEGSVSAPHYDFTSNGFKIRTTDSAWNQSSNTYIYAAFAESPFAYSRAR